jgi:hypothetical protein
MASMQKMFMSERGELAGTGSVIFPVLLVFRLLFFSAWPAQSLLIDQGVQQTLIAGVGAVAFHHFGSWPGMMRLGSSAMSVVCPSHRPWQ